MKQLRKQMRKKPLPNPMHNKPVPRARYGKMLEKACHSEPVRTLAWESVSKRELRIATGGDTALAMTMRDTYSHKRI